MDRMISLAVKTTGPTDYFGTFQDMSELANTLGTNHDYVSMSAHVIPENSDDEAQNEELYHDDYTLMKVRKAIDKASPDLTSEEVDDIINELLNAGILFRERPKSKGE